MLFVFYFHFDCWQLIELGGTLHKTEINCSEQMTSQSNIVVSAAVSPCAGHCNCTFLAIASFDQEM